MISVCLASYNGALYIEKQLRSILCQLSESDEIIIVDDCSTDSTLTVINDITDTRIHVYCNGYNEGVIKTFERSINYAIGDIIYLCDQDDVWHANKVEMFECVFEKNPDVMLVLSDARVIDDNGKVIAESFYKKRGAFVSGVLPNIIKNKYLGCTMAFRKFLVDKVLPFPGNIPMHDIWIGIICAIYGKDYFINTSLIDYRRHQNNASPEKRQGFVQMVLWRWSLLNNLCLRMVALLFKHSS